MQVNARAQFEIAGETKAIVNFLCLSLIVVGNINQAIEQRHFETLKRWVSELRRVCPVEVRSKIEVGRKR